MTERKTNLMGEAALADPRTGTALCYEEDAWYRPDPVRDSIPDIKAHLERHPVMAERPHTLLADEEDAWARP